MARKRIAMRRPAITPWIAPSQGTIFLVFSLIFVVYLVSPTITSFDSRWTVHTALSILHEGDTDLDEYFEIIERNDGYAIETHGGRRYTFFPVGTAVILAPVIFVQEILFEFSRAGRFQAAIAGVAGQLGISAEDVEIVHFHPAVEHVNAALLTTLAVFFLFQTLRQRSSFGVALSVALVFAFSTPAWSTTSRALWSHTACMLRLILALYFLVLGQKRPGWIAYISIPLALAFIIRPTAGVPIAFFTGYVFLFHRPQLIRYFLYAAPFALLLFAYNYSVYGEFLSPYSEPGRVFSGQYFLEALVGNLVSPARGLLVFCPVLLLSFWAAFNPAWRKARFEWMLMGIIGSHWLLISSFQHWWAGYSFGPRLFSDVMPFLCYFLVHPFGAIAQLEAPVRKRAGYLLVALLAAPGLYIHYQGATNFESYLWNGDPQDIDTHPERIWHWSDPPFLR